MHIDEPTRMLLTAAVRDQTPIDAFERLARAIKDWDTVLSAGREHRLLAILFHKLNGADISVPKSVCERLKADYDRNTFHTLANAAELVALAQAFEAEDIRAMPHKGLALASAAYRNPASRAAGDVDLLIFEEDRERATAVLRARGFQLATPVLEDGSPAIPGHYEFHFERKRDGMVVELHWRLQLLEAKYGGRFQRDLGMEWAWPRRCSVTIAGVDLPNLDPVSNLLMLCMHGAKHRWSRLAWVYDIAQLLEATPELDWDRAVNEAKAMGLRRVLALGTLLTQRICGVTVPHQVARGFESDRVARKLAAYFQNGIFAAPGQSPPGAMPYSIQILDLPDRIRWLSRLEFLAPNERDRKFLRLPNRLSPLYYLIRPVRMLFDRSPR